MSRMRQGGLAAAAAHYEVFGPLWDHILGNSNITLVSKEDAAQTRHIGLDAHSKRCTAVVMDSKGKILQKEVFTTSEREFLRFVDSVKRPRVLTFEEMNIAQWLYILLKDRVDQIQVAHAWPSKMTQSVGHFY